LCEETTYEEELDKLSTAEQFIRAMTDDAEKEDSSEEE